MNKMSFFSFSYLILGRGISHFLNLCAQKTRVAPLALGSRLWWLPRVVSAAFSEEARTSELHVSVVMLGRGTGRKKHKALYFSSVVKWKGELGLRDTD